MTFANTQTLKEHIAEEGKVDSDYDVLKQGIGIIPFRDTKTSSFRRCAAYWELMIERHGSKQHTTVVAFDGDMWYIWCGDSFLSGKYDMETLEDALSICKDKDEERAIHKSFGLFKKDSGCGFWKSNSDRTQLTCKHTKNLYTNLTDDIIEKIETLYFSGTTNGRSRRKPIELLQKYAFKKHILLKGEKGSGKTYIAKKYAFDNAEVVVEIIGNDGLESSGLLGHLVPYAMSVKKPGQTSLFESNEETKTGLIFKYGPLSKAFKNAKEGKKTIVVFDEFLRVPSSQMQILVGALSPNHKGEYVLPTENMVEVDGELYEETIICPKENLWVIATTNAGSSYEVSEIDSALDDRFQTIRMDSDIDELKKILLSKAAKRGFNSVIVDKLLDFYKDMEKLLLDKRLQNICNSRHLIEALENAIDGDDIGETLYETREKWVSDKADGQPDEMELRAVEKTIQAHFSTL